MWGSHKIDVRSVPEGNDEGSRASVMRPFPRESLPMKPEEEDLANESY